VNELSIIPCPFGPALPALIDTAGEWAASRFLEFFSVNYPQPKYRCGLQARGKVIPELVQGEGITRIEDVLSDDRRR